MASSCQKPHQRVGPAETTRQAGDLFQNSRSRWIAHSSGSQAFSRQFGIGFIRSTDVLKCTHMSYKNRKQASR